MADDLDKKNIEEIEGITKDLAKNFSNIKKSLDEINDETNAWEDVSKRIAANKQAIANSEKLTESISKRILDTNIEIAKAQYLFDSESGVNGKKAIEAKKMENELLIHGLQLDIARTSRTKKGREEILLNEERIKSIRDQILQQDDELNQFAANRAKYGGTTLTQMRSQVSNLEVMKKDATELMSSEIKKTKTLQVQQSIYSNLLKPLLGDSKEFGKLMEIGSKIMKGGIEAYFAILGASVERWIELDKAAGEFRKTTGLIVPQMLHIEKAVRQINTEFSYMGITLEAGYKAAASLYGALSVSNLVTKELISFTAQMAENLGLSSDSVAEFYSKFSEISKSSGTTAQNVIVMGTALSDMAGVAPKQVIEDMAKASGNTLMFLAKSPMQLIRATVEARRLGTTVDKLADAARSMLNYQDSMTAELEASALLNQNISFQRARQLAWEGKIVESREEALRVIQSTGDFTKKSIWQQEAMAKAAGMTVEEVTKQLNQKKMLNALQFSGNAADREQYKSYMAMTAKMKANEKAAREDLVGRGREMVKQQMIQAEMDKLANSLKAVWISIQDALLPIANAIMPTVLGVLRVLGSTIRIIGGLVKLAFLPFQSLLDMIPKTEDGLSGWEFILKKMEVGISAVADWAKRFSEWMDKSEETGSSTVKWILGLLVPLGTMWAISRGISATWSFGGKLLSGIKGFGKGIWDTTKGLFKMSSAAKEATASANKIKTPVTNQRGGLSNFLSGIKWNDVGKMAAMMVILAGGIWALGKALKTFNEVSWESIGKGATALVGLVGAMKLVSMIPVNVAGVLTTAAAMVVMAGGLWVLGEALNKFNTVDWTSIGKAAVALGGLAIIGAIAGFLPPVALGMIAVGAAAALLGTGLLAAGVGFALFGKGIEFVGAGISKVIDSISGGISKVISSISTGVTSAADALVKIVQPIKELSDIGLVKFGKVALGISAIASALGELSKAFSGTAVFNNLVALTNLSKRLDIVADALMLIKQNSSIDFKISGIKDFQEMMKNPIDLTSKVEAQIKVAVETVSVRIENLDTLPEMIDKLADAVLKLGGTAGSASTVVNTQPATDNSTVVAKIDELIILMKSGVKVDMDKMSFLRGMSSLAR